MTPEGREHADSYYKAADSWATDKVEALRASRRIAWIVAIVATFATLALALTLVLLLPLKTVVPYTLMVDRQTGYVQALNPIDASRIAPDAALTQSFLVQYVIARESFDFATVQADYRKTALWSADAARTDYVAAMQVSNPGSPLNTLLRGTLVETRIRSVSSLGGRTALVRFETVRRDRSGSVQPMQSWVAIVTYRFSDAPMTVEDRFINPLGFQVVRYRRNAETPPLAAPSLPSTQRSAQSTPILTGRPPPTLGSGTTAGQNQTTAEPTR